MSYMLHLGNTFAVPCPHTEIAEQVAVFLGKITVKLAALTFHKAVQAKYISVNIVQGSVRFAAASAFQCVCSA